MNKAIANILNKSLGMWFEDLNSEQLNLSIFSGRICLTKLKLKSDFLDILGLPFALKLGSVEKIEVKIPWSSWYSSPLEVTISDVNLLLTPIPVKNWSESKEKSSLLLTRKYYLDHFEMMNQDDLEMSQESNNSILTSKIMDNLHLKLENLYIRYEDEFYSTEAFTLGAFIKSAVVFNCNSLWQQDFERTDRIFKLLQINEAFFFIDYTEGIVVCQDWFEGTVEESLWQLSREEKQGSICHKYLFSPTSLRVEICINKQELKNFPIYSAKVVLGNLKIQLHVSQLDYLLCIKKFIIEHYLFKKNVENSVKYRNFQSEEIKIYRELYKDYRNSLKNDENFQLKQFFTEKLEIMESEIFIEDIQMQRKSVINDFKLKKLENEKKEEIQNIQKLGNQRGFKRLFTFLTPRKLNPELDQSIKEKLSSAEMDLANIENRTSSAIRKITRAKTNRLEFMTDRPIYSFSFEINKLDAEFLEENKEICQVEFSKLFVEVTLRLISYKFLIGSKSFIVWNKNHGSIFPALLKSGRFEFEFDDLDLKFFRFLQMDPNLFVDVEAFFYIFFILNGFLNQNSNTEDSLDSNSSLKTEEEVWKVYSMVQNLLEFGVSNNYCIDFKVNNLKIYIPADSRDDDSAIFLTEIRSIVTSTSKENKSSVQFDLHKLDIENISLYSTIENHKETLLEPFSLSSLINICKTVNCFRSGYRLDCTISPILINISHESIKLFKKFLKILSKYKSSDSDSEIIENSNPGLDSFIQNLGDVIQTKILLKFESISLKIKDFLLSAEDFEGRLKISRNKNVLFSASAHEIFLKNDGFNEKFLKITKSSNRDHSVKVVASYQPSEKLVFVSLKFGNFQGCFNLDLLENLKKHYLSFFFPVKKNRYSSKPVENNPKSRNIKISFFVDNFSVLLFDETNDDWNSLNVSFMVNFSYTSSDSLQFQSDHQWVKINKKILKSFNEGTVLISALRVELQKDLTTKKINEPSRIMVDFSHQYSSNSLPVIYTNVKICQLSLNLGFRDIFFLNSLFKKLQASFSPQEKEEKSSQTINFEVSSLEIVLNEDTTEKPLLLCKSKVKNIFITQSQSSTVITSEIISYFFDTHLKKWQLFQDTSKFLIKFQKTSPQESEILISNDSKLSLYLTPSFCEIFGTIQQRLYENPEIWGKKPRNFQKFQENLDYEIINNLGVDIEFWSFKSPRQVLKPFQSKILKSSDLSNFYLQSHSSKVRPLEIPHKISIEFNYFQETKTIESLSIHLQGFETVSLGDCEIRKQVKMLNGFNQVIFSSCLFILNETEESLIIGHLDEELLFDDLFALPLIWEVDEVFIQSMNQKVFIKSQELIQVGHGRFVGCDPSSFDYEGQDYDGFLLRPVYLFHNKLPYDIIISSNNIQETAVSAWNVGKVYSIGISSSSITLSICVNGMHFSTESFKLDCLSQFVRICCQVESFVMVSVVDLTTSCIQAVVSCENIVANLTDYQMEINKVKIPRQCILMCKKFQKGAVKVRINDESFKRVNVNALGLTQHAYLDDLAGNYIAFSVIVAEDCQKFSYKLIKILPRFVIKNILSIPIFIREIYKSKVFDHLKLDPGQLIHFPFKNRKKNLTIQFSEDLESWTSSFLIDQIDDFQVKFKSNQKRKRKLSGFFKKDLDWFMPSPENLGFFISRVSVFVENQDVFNVLIREPDEADFIIYNSSNFDIEIKQKFTETCFRVLEPGNTLTWVFDDLLMDKKKVLINLQGEKKSFSLHEFKKNNKTIGNCCVRQLCNGNTRVLEVYQETHRKSFLTLNVFSGISSEIATKYILNLNQISLTLFTETYEEQALATFFNFTLTYSKTLRKLSEKQTHFSSVDVNFQNFQLDNMQNLQLFFPVIISRSPSVTSSPIFHLHYSREYFKSQSPSFASKDHFPIFEIHLEPLTLNLDYEVLSSLLTLQKLYLQKYYQIKSSPSLHLEVPSCPFTFPLPYEDSSKSYFDLLIFQELSLTLTLRKLRKSLVLQNYSEFLQIFANNFIDIARVTDSQLNLSQVIISHSFHSKYSIFWKVLQNHARQGLFQFYRILGAAEILGKPISLIKKLGTGVFEFFALPGKGLVNGYQPFVEGVSKGTKALVGNVLDGGFDSLAGVTGSVYNMISEEHSGENPVFDKLGIYDLKSGIKSLAVKPFTRLENEGIKGFLHQFVVGVFKASVSPLAAALHFSHTVSVLVSEEGRKIKDLPKPTQVRPKLLLTSFKDFFILPCSSQVLEQEKIQEVLFFIQLKNEEVFITPEKILMVSSGFLTKSIKRQFVTTCEVFSQGLKFIIVVKTSKKSYKLVSDNLVQALKLFHVLK